MAKTTLGIFGDSYAARHHKNPAKHWSDYLTDQYRVDNWGVRGSSLFYSLIRLKEFHHKYEKIIFVLTSPGRLWLRDLFDPKSPDYTSSFVVNYTNSKINEDFFTNKSPEKSLIINSFKAAADYYKYLQDPVFDELVHDLMIPEIKKTRSDALIITGSRVNNSSIVGYKGSIEDISRMEEKYWGIEDNYDLCMAENIDDIRHSHISNVNNKILAEKIVGWLDCGTITGIDPKDFSLPDYAKEHYMIKG